MMGYRKVMMIGLVVVIGFTAAAMAQAPPAVTVDCAAGDSLAQAVQAATPGTTIQVSGTCAETFTITTDDLTIEGQEGTIIDGQGASEIVVNIDAARRVTIRNVTIQNGLDGMQVSRSAAVTLEAITLQDNSRDGIRLNWNAYVEVTGCNLLRNGDDGLDIHASTVNARDCTARENGDDGITAFRGGSINLLGSTTVSNNGDDGINVLHNAQIAITGTVVVTENGDDGFVLSINASMLVSGATWTLTRNGQTEASGDGMQITDGASLVAFRDSSIEASDNANNGFALARNTTLSAFGGALLAARNGGSGFLVAFLSVANVVGASLTSMDNVTSDIDVAPDSICVGCP